MGVRWGGKGGRQYGTNKIKQGKGGWEKGKEQRECEENPKRTFSFSHSPLQQAAFPAGKHC